MEEEEEDEELFVVLECPPLLFALIEPLEPLLLGCMIVDFVDEELSSEGDDDVDVDEVEQTS